MVTKGTFRDPNNGSYEPKYVLTLKVDREFVDGVAKLRFGVTYFDTSTLKMHIGQFSDDENLTNFRTLVT